MSKHRDYNVNDPLPSAYMDALSEFISTHASPNLLLTKDNTTVFLTAGAGNDQVALGMGGTMRFVSATISTAHPAGGAGTYPVFATAAALDEAAEDGGTFNYGFALEVRSAGNPSTAVWRKIGETLWDGSRIIDVRTTVHAVTTRSEDLGFVKDWFRPTTGTPTPRGYAICDGTAWSSIPNDMGLTTGNIINLTDRFVMGVPLARMAETGGANTRNLEHAHTITVNSGGSHSHTGSAPDHLHGAGTLYANTPGSRGNPVQHGGTIEAVAYQNHTHDVEGTTGAADRALSFTTSTHTGHGHTATSDNRLSSAQDFRPAYTGLLKVMKVRHI